MIDLAKFGTGYENIPALLVALNDSFCSADNRRGILALLNQMNLGGHVPGVSIADQGYYPLPDELLKECTKSLDTASKGRDPYIASEAKNLLEKVRTGFPEFR